MIEFTTMYGRQYAMDLDKWKFQKGDICWIVGENTHSYQVQNSEEDEITVPKSTFIDHGIEIVKDKIFLSDVLYKRLFGKDCIDRMQPVPDEDKSDCDAYLELLLKYRHLVLSQPEYYLLTASTLKSHIRFVGMSYSLGSLIESIESGNHIYYDRIGNHQEMYFISMQCGLSPSEFTEAIFWSKKSGKLIRFKRQDEYNFSSSISIRELKKRVREPEVQLSFQGRILDRLKGEIWKLENPRS